MWITPHPNGHLQAVGTDDAGRRQYLYHPQWRAEPRRREVRPDPRLRQGAVEGARAGAGRHRRRGHVAGARVRRRRTPARPRLLPDRQRRLHRHQRLLRPHHDAARSTCRGTRAGCASASPASRASSTASTSTTRRRSSALDVMRRRRGGGDELLAWKDGRTWRDLSSADVNDYIRGCFGIEATAKDFRTWHATVIAASALAETDEPGETKASRKRAVSARHEGGLGVPRQHPDPGPHGVRRPAGRRGLRAGPDHQGPRLATTPTTPGRRRSSAPCSSCWQPERRLVTRRAHSSQRTGARASQAQLLATTWSIAAVSFSTSAGSIAGYIAIRSWLRPSLR